MAELSLNIYSRPTPTHDLSTWSSNFVVSVLSPSGHQVFMALTSSFFSMMRISFGIRLLQDITSKIQNQDVFLEESFNVSREYGIPSNGVSFLLLHDPDQFHRNGVRCPIIHPAFPLTSTPLLEEPTQVVTPKQKIDMLVGIFERFDIKFVKPSPPMCTFTIGACAKEVPRNRKRTKSAQEEGGEMQFDGMQFDGMQGNEVQFDGMQGNEVQFDGMQGNEVQFDGMQGNEVQFDGMQGNEVQFDGMQGNEAQGNEVQGGFLEDFGVDSVLEEANYRSLSSLDTQPVTRSLPRGAQFRSFSSGVQHGQMYSNARGGGAAAGALPKALRLLRTSAHDVLARWPHRPPGHVTASLRYSWDWR